MTVSELTMLALAQEGGGQGGGMMSLILQVGLIILIFYFLLIRPNQKRAKEHQNMISNLKRDDEVVTTGGIHGVITGLTDQVVTLEIAPNVRIKVQRNQVAGLKGTEAASEKK